MITPTGGGLTAGERKKMTYKELVEKEKRDWIGKEVAYLGKMYIVVDVDYNGALLINKPARFTETTAISRFDLDK
jgi:hypothetical protein